MDHAKMRLRRHLKQLGIWEDRLPIPPRVRLNLPMPDVRTPLMYTSTIKALMDDFELLASIEGVDPWRLQYLMYRSTRRTDHAIQGATQALEPIPYRSLIPGAHLS